MKKIILILFISLISSSVVYAKCQRRVALSYFYDNHQTLRPTIDIVARQLDKKKYRDRISIQAKNGTIHRLFDIFGENTFQNALMMNVSIEGDTSYCSIRVNVQTIKHMRATSDQIELFNEEGDCVVVNKNLKKALKEELPKCRQ